MIAHPILVEAILKHGKQVENHRLLGWTCLGGPWTSANVKIPDGTYTLPNLELQQGQKTDKSQTTRIAQGYAGPAIFKEPRPENPLKTPDEAPNCRGKNPRKPR